VFATFAPAMFVGPDLDRLYATSPADQDRFYAGSLTELLNGRPD
jgi:hypothetical protein